MLTKHLEVVLVPGAPIHKWYNMVEGIPFVFVTAPATDVAFPILLAQYLLSPLPTPFAVLVVSMATHGVKR